MRRCARRRDGGQPVTSVVRGSARAAARRAPQGAKAELPAACGELPAGACARPAEPSPSHRPPGRASSREINAPFGARRAPRALEDVRKVLTA